MDTAHRHLILISSLPRPGRVRDALLHRVRAQAGGGGRHEEGRTEGEAVVLHDAVTTAASLSCIYFLYFQLADENRNIEGIEVHGASAFKVSRHVHHSCSCHVSRVTCPDHARALLQGGLVHLGGAGGHHRVRGQAVLHVDTHQEVRVEVMSCHVMSCHVMSHK